MSSEDSYTPPNEMPPAPIHKVLVGQKAIVTGASKGLGQAMAIGFARAGAGRRRELQFGRGRCA